MAVANRVFFITLSLQKRGKGYALSILKLYHKNVTILLQVLNLVLGERLEPF